MHKLILLISMLTSSALASIPENELDKADNETTWYVTEQNFWDIIKTVYDIYKPVFDGLKTDTGETVSWWFESDWNSHTVNIYSKKEKVPPYNWNRWTIQVHGALARRVQMTKEGFALALCHEIGHQIGGYKFMDYLPKSCEGQADYYATHVCARKVFAKWSNADLKKTPLMIELCDKNFDTKAERDVCLYSIAGSQSLSEVMYVANQQTRTPEIDSPDNFKAKLTYQLHTPAQCRLDTFIAGILCDKTWDDKRIPVEKNAVCRNRPSCWYAP